MVEQKNQILTGSKFYIPTSIPPRMPKFKVENLNRLRPEIQLKYKDIFDLKEFYEALRQWLFEYGWMDTEDKTEHFESYYGENIDQGGVREIWMRWRPYRPAANSDYINFYLDFNWHIVGLTSTEIVRDGSKLKAHKGEVEIKINAWYELKFVSDFKSHNLLKYFASLFKRRVYKKDVAQRKKEFYQELYEMQTFIKQWFKLKRYLPYEETKNFYRSYAWPSHIPEQQ